MTEIIDGGYGLKDIIANKAYHAAKHTNTTLFNPKSEIAIDDYRAFLYARDKNPTAADIAFWESIGKEQRLPDQYIKENIRELENQAELQNMVKRMKDYNKKLYPKTHELRQTLLENNRFSLNCVKPKLSKMTKFLWNVIGSYVENYSRLFM